jgi:hypothetical protein
MSVIYSECVFLALVIRHALRMRSVILPSVTCHALLYFSTLSYKRHDYRGKKFTDYIICVFWFSVQSLAETFLIIRRNERYTIRNVYWSASCKVPDILSDFHETWIFVTDLKKNSNIKLHKNPCNGSRFVPCGQTDRRLDVKLIVAFRSFTQVRKQPYAFKCLREYILL